MDAWFDKLMKAVEEYGLFTVIIVIIVLLLAYYIYSSNKALERFEQQSMENEKKCKETLMTFGQRIVEELVFTKNDNRPRQNLPSLMDTFVNIRVTMKDNCKETMLASKADRVAIYLFHDAVRTPNGISFLRISCVCEAIRVGSGIREKIAEHSNMPLNLFDTLKHELINKSSYAIVNTPDLKRSNNKIFISSDKIKFSYAISIFDNNNNTLGFILAEFHCDYNDNKLRGLYTKIYPLVSQITLVLNYSNYLIINLNKENDTDQ